MGNNLALLFGFVLIMPTIFFGVDLYLLSNGYVSLETRATTVGYTISLEGGIRASLVEELASEKISLYCHEGCDVISVGESVHYELKQDYTPFIMGREEIEIRVSRYIIVGYL